MVIKTKVFSAIISLLIFLTISSANVFAQVNPPNFPSCVNPQGKEIANYPSGTHGVAGIVTLYDGADTVYGISEEVIMQCLCPTNGEGIQTNWWKIPQLSSDEIENFKIQGWIFMADGSAWGLDPAAYLAKNSNFSCRTSSSSNSNNSSSAIGGITSIGDILGLAATGNIKTVYYLLIIGFASLSIGHLLSRKSN